MKTRSPLGCLVFVALFWSAIVGLFDGFIGYNIYWQMRAESYPTVTGHVTASSVESHYDSDGTTHSAEVVFTYTVNGQEYSADTYRYGSNMSTSDEEYIDSIARQFPQGAEVSVHYNPDDPTDAVLMTGVQGMDLFLLLFMTPFNLIGLGLWGFVFGGFRTMRKRPEAGGVPIMKKGELTHIRLPRLSPFLAAGLTALGISFISIFIVAFGFGMNPPLIAIGIVWGIVLIPAMYVYHRRRFTLGSGDKDLVIDESTATLSLPQTFGRRTDVIVPRRAVEGIEIETVNHQTNKGGVRHSYAPHLTWMDESGQPRREKLADWNDESKANAFTDWLRGRLERDS